MYPGIRCLARVALGVGLLLHAGADTLVLEPDADTSLLELQPDFNLGAQSDLPAGTLGSAAQQTRSRMLLRFDLAGALPVGAVIEAASLTLTVTRVPDGGGTPSQFSLHRMLRSWGEGQRSGSLPGGAPAVAGEATWDHRASPDLPWAEPGGVPGMDFADEPSSTERIQGRGEYGFEFGALQVAELQTWVREPDTNFGWILLSRSEGEARTARRFGSREHALAETRPRLTLEYSLSGIIPPEIRGFVLESDSARVVVDLQPGVNQNLEVSSAPVGMPWLPIAAVTETNTAGQLILIDPTPLASQRYYRVAASL